ncbi:MAG: acetyl-CoA carboxylase subunit beta [Lentisphaerae bacterium RIFOXYB12_FULL_65_16]|nr:MAG: acetyl-CoA carboxylase subunit beta [Lentisphaerae bacterium RIFOXYA12_64_32]OGV93816.1 MAG: acetyl-CoA carboxylase subunit beta [Lentisphaerae bacterium RIFOXYB12_FULL_65_16]
MPLIRKQNYSSAQAPKKADEGKLWATCAGCGAAIYHATLDENWQVCADCGHHYPLSAPRRVGLLVDPDTFVETDAGLESVDTLGFGAALYTDRLTAAREATGMNDAVLCGTATLAGRPLALGVMDCRFMDGSLGSVIGEKIARLAELATQKGLPLVLITASSGARIQEGALGLMQMAKTAGALGRHRHAGLLTVVILTHPTSGTVLASFASLGDVILAEPGARIGFTGPRALRRAAGNALPPGIQTAEFLLEHGFIDRVVPRPRQRQELGLLLEYFSGAVRCHAPAVGV